VITVESKPERMKALQWNQPGDGTDLGVHSYNLGAETRYGLDTMSGLQRVKPGDWIVLLGSGLRDARVYSPSEFHHKFKIIEEGQT
jgi:hypothetical protein